MNVLIYGNSDDKETLIRLMESQASMAFRILEFTQTDDYDQYVNLLQKKDYEMVFVTMDNAAGMEGVIAVQNLKPEMPIIWFSNDKYFVAQSYRLGVTYFAVKPINEKMIKLALDRYQRIVPNTL